MKDNVNNPIHYNQGGIECIEAIKAATVGKTGIEAFCVGNVIKYLWRFEEKNGLEDVKKAQWYLNRLIQEMEENTNLHEDELCENCKYFAISENQYPCIECKHSVSLNSPERETRKSYFIKNNS